MSERHDTGHRSASRPPRRHSRPASTGAVSRRCPSTPEFKEFLHREFPQNASEWLDPVGRRGFLKLMSASLALAGVSACTRQPTEELVPYVRQPEELVPGKPLFYATAMPFAGSGIGLLVESHEGRPTKIEGNPDHPSSRGATDVFAQAAILGLYDPDRSTTITNLGEIRPFSAFFAALRGVLAAQQAKKGAGLRILTETVASPTLAAQIEDDPDARCPRRRWVQWEPVGRHNAREGSRLAFGEYVDAAVRAREGRRHPVARRRLHVHRRRRACGTRARSRRAAAPRAPAAAQPALRGREHADRSAARAPIIACRSRPRSIERVRARGGVAARCGRRRGRSAAAKPPPRGSRRSWRTCRPRKGRSVVIAGDSAPPSVHALAHAMNAALGNVGADGHLHADARKCGRRTSCADLRDAGRRHERRHGGLPPDPRRQPGLHGAGRPEVRRRAAEGARCARTSGCTRTRPPSCASGTCPRRTSSRRGATCAPTTAPSRSCSRSSRRSTAASRRTKCWPR